MLCRAYNSMNTALTYYHYSFELKMNSSKFVSFNRTHKREVKAVNNSISLDNTGKDR